MPCPDGAALGRALREPLRGARVLYPCAEDRRPGLERTLATAARIEAWPLYRTTALPDAPARVDAALRGVPADAVLVHSPSAARALAGVELGSAAVLCLSAAVADALPAGVGGVPRVAERPDEAALLRLAGLA